MSAEAILGTSGMLGNMVGGLTSFFGGQSAKDAIRQGRNTANAYDKQGIGEYRSAIDQSVGRANPYMSAGAGAIQSQQDLLSNGQPRTSGAFNFDAWKDPSTAYSISESNKALQAAGLAGGNAGGALAKALQGNANSLAQGAYQNAYQRYLQQNQQDFGQQQQIFQNQLGGWQNLGNQGANMVSSINSLGMQGAGGMANLYNSMANRSYDSGLQLGGVNASQASGIGKSIQSGISDVGSMLAGII